MPRADISRRDLARIRSDLAGLSVEVGLIRLERILARKDWSDQPREPAGQPGGGRWTSGGPSASGAPADNRDPDTTGSIGGGASAAQTREEVVTEDGSRVLTIRIRSNPHAEWDEQHTVTAPDGTETVFETTGPTQTIRDGKTGEILGRSRLTSEGVEPEAFVHPARSVRRLLSDLQRQAARTLEAAGTLFAVLADRNDSDRKAVFVAPASEYLAGDTYNARAVWVGAVSQRDLDHLCPRNGEVQALARSVAASVRASGGYKTEQDFGNIVHKIIEDAIDARNDPDLVAEISYQAATGGDAFYGMKQSIRLDVLEKVDNSTVCVYDHKTGKSQLRPRRAVDIMTVVQKRFRGAQKYIMIEVRPEP